MRCRAGWVLLVLFAAAAPGLAGERTAGKPRLEVRTTARAMLPPVEVVAVAELVGGEDLEELYCAGLEWDWGDGTKSYRESDCAPFEADAGIDRFFSARHVYRQPGSFTVQVRLVRDERDLARARTSVQVGGRMASSFWE